MPESLQRGTHTMDLGRALTETGTVWLKIRDNKAGDIQEGRQSCRITVWSGLPCPLQHSERRFYALYVYYKDILNILQLYTSASNKRFWNTSVEICHKWTHWNTGKIITGIQILSVHRELLSLLKGRTSLLTIVFGFVSLINIYPWHWTRTSWGQVTINYLCGLSHKHSVGEKGDAQ